MVIVLLFAAVWLQLTTQVFGGNAGSSVSLEVMLQITGTNLFLLRA